MTTKEHPTPRTDEPHGAIIARAIGLPAVMNASGAPDAFENRVMITVGGTNIKVILNSNAKRERLVHLKPSETMLVMSQITGY